MVCDQTPQCGFFTNFSNGWCLLKKTCNSQTVADDSSAATYQRDPSTVLEISKRGWTDTVTFYTSTYRFERSSKPSGGYWKAEGNVLMLKWDTGVTEYVRSFDLAYTFANAAGTSLSSSNPPHWWTMQFQMCTYTITVGRQWGPSFEKTASASPGSTFQVDGVEENEYCSSNGYGDGANVIRNQAGVRVAAGTCSSEQNWVVSATLVSCGQADPLEAAESAASAAGAQTMVMVALSTSVLFLGCALTYWRVRKRANGGKCQSCSCMSWDPETGAAETKPHTIGHLSEIWGQDGIAVSAAGFGDGWDEPVLDEMPEDGIDVDAAYYTDMEMEVDLDLAAIRDAHENFQRDDTNETDKERKGFSCDEDLDLDMERDQGPFATQFMAWEL
jgi:hypothetical protein